MSKLFSKPHPSKDLAHPVPEDPLPRATTSIPNQIHQVLRRRPSKVTKSGPLERHGKSPSVNNTSLGSHPSVNTTSVSSHPSQDSCSYYKPRTLWDTRDTFLPTAKPPPPLPKLDKLKRTVSQHHAKAPVGAAMPTPIYRQPCATSSQSTSTGQSSNDLPIFDISREPHMEAAPKTRGTLVRSTTRITASSGTSDESLSRWKLPSRWAMPSADADKEAKPGAMSLLRFGSRKRAKSIPASSDHDAHPTDKITLELL